MLRRSEGRILWRARTEKEQESLFSSFELESPIKRSWLADKFKLGGAPLQQQRFLSQEKKTILTLKISSNILVHCEEKEEQEDSSCVGRVMMVMRVRNLLCGHGEQGGHSKRDSSRHCVGVQPEAHLAVGFVPSNVKPLLENRSGVFTQETMTSIQQGTQIVRRQ